MQARFTRYNKKVRSRNSVTPLTPFQGLLKLVILILVLVAGMSGSNAQERQRPFRGGGPGGFGGFGSIDAITLMRSEQIQTELKITEPQKEKIQEAVEAMGEQMRGLMAGLRELSSQEREGRFTEIRRERAKLNKVATKAIEAALSEDQVRRLDQIVLQVRGVRALVGDDLASKLEMSDQQRETIRKIFVEQEKNVRELFQSASNLPREERLQLVAKMREMQAGIESRTLEVLTHQQQTAFDKLKGAKFALDRRSLFGGFGGNPRRPGGQGETRVRPPSEP